MKFGDLKTGNCIHIIEDANADLKVSTAKVKTAGSPYFDPQPLGGTTVQQVVDITIERNGRAETYKIPEALTTTCAGNIIMFADKETFLNELQSMRAQSEDAIASVERHRERLASIDKAMEEFNPAIREKRQTDERLDRMEAMIEEMRNHLCR